MKSKILFAEVSVLGNVVAHPDVAIADVELEFFGEGTSKDTIRTTGTSRRFNGDENTKKDHPDTNVGAKLALARALRSMANTLERQADGQLKCNEDNREQRKVQKELRKQQQLKDKKRQEKKLKKQDAKLTVADIVTDAVVEEIIIKAEKPKSNGTKKSLVAEHPVRYMETRS